MTIDFETIAATEHNVIAHHAILLAEAANPIRLIGLFSKHIYVIARGSLSRIEVLKIEVRRWILGFHPYLSVFHQRLDMRIFLSDFSWFDPNRGAQTDVPGCTIEIACNYDPAATINDGTCDFVSCLVLVSTDAAA